MKIETLVTRLLFAGLALSLVFIYFSQERLFSFMTKGDNALGFERYFRIASTILVIAAAFITLFFVKKKYAFSIYFAYGILLVYLILNFLISGGDILNPTDIMNTKGFGVWLCFGLIFVSYDEYRYTLFKRFLFMAIIVIALLSCYNFFEFGAGLYRGQALSKYRVYAVNYVWVAPYVFLILKGNKKLAWLRIFALFMGLILALITQTRSFILIYFMVLIFDYFHTKKKTPYLVAFSVFMVLAVYFITNMDIISRSLDLLINRGVNDTRTGQLSLFFNQLNIIEIIPGKGFFASYKFGNTELYFLDNQWLYLLWWGGLIPVTAYFYLTAIIPFKMFITSNISYETRVECFIMLLWVLGLAGLAIYTTMNFDFFFLVISIIQGRVLYKYSLLKND
ncbi:hypothetical protein ACFQZJ_18880 [Maribacter chungangensis]|uniref:O-antigen ligase family protein n=1 Tax=Maribacter chungangensis TaxID=1069117 RepID=A0ABW3B8S3_9FLAO